MRASYAQTRIRPMRMRSASTYPYRSSARRRSDRVIAADVGYWHRTCPLLGVKRTWALAVHMSAAASPGVGSALGTREGKPMPWNPEDAERHTKKADDTKRQRTWAEVANSVLSDTGDEGRAIREANSAVVRPGHSGVTGYDT